MDARSILARYFARDESAIAQTANTYGKRLHRLSYGILKNVEDAAECVSDTYLKAWEKIPPQTPTYFYAFLAKICRFLCFGRLDYQKAQKRNVELVTLSDELLCCIPDRLAGAEQEDGEIARALTDFLDTLPEESCRIFMRRYWYCEPICDIAARYRSSESKVKTSLCRTRNKLKDYLETEGIFR